LAREINNDNAKIRRLELTNGRLNGFANMSENIRIERERGERKVIQSQRRVSAVKSKQAAAQLDRDTLEQENESLRGEIKKFQTFLGLRVCRDNSSQINQNYSSLALKFLEASTIHH